MSLETYAHPIMPRIGTQPQEQERHCLTWVPVASPGVAESAERRHGLVTHQKLKPSVQTDRQGEGVCERLTCGSGTRRISTWVGYGEAGRFLFFWLEPLAGWCCDGMKEQGRGWEGQTWRKNELYLGIQGGARSCEMKHSQ